MQKKQNKLGLNERWERNENKDIWMTKKEKYIKKS